MYHLIDFDVYWHCCKLAAVLEIEKMLWQSCSEVASAQRTLLYTGYLAFVAYHKESNLQLLQLLGLLIVSFATNNFIQTEHIPKTINNHKYRLVRKYTLPQSSVPGFLSL